MSAMLSVLILEDQPDAVLMLRQVVEECFPEVQIAHASSLAQVKEFTQVRFDYALVDLRLPDGLSLDWLTSFKQANPSTMAVVTSLYDDDDLVFASLRAGADGYLLKGDGPEALVAAFKRVLLGEPPISPAIARKLMHQFRAPLEVQVAAPSILTPREEEVLALIGTGLLIKQVAGKLNLSPHTVNDNIKSIYRKLGIRTRAQAAHEAAKRGLTKPA